jgi:hypothetical protein
MTRIRDWSFNELPTRPMVRVDLDTRRMNADFEASLRMVLDRLPQDGLISLRFHGPLRKEALECLRASALRAIAPATMNISVRLPGNVAANKRE